MKAIILALVTLAAQSAMAVPARRLFARDECLIEDLCTESAVLDHYFCCSNLIYPEALVEVECADECHPIDDGTHEFQCGENETGWHCHAHSH